MPLVIREESNGVVVEVVGRFDVLTAPAVKEELLRLSDKGTENLIVSLEKLDFVDCSGIGALAVANRALTAAGRPPLAVAAPTKQAELVLTITRLDSVFRVCGTVKQALATSV